MIIWQIVLLVIGFALLVKGADFLVDGSSGVARKLHVPEIVIGLTIVAFGTSMPELSVAFQAFASGSTDLTLGDIIGCAISNIFLLLGMAAIIRPVKVSKETFKRDIPFYVAVIIIFAGLLIFGSTIGGGKISRISGGILLGLFAVFLGLTISTARKGIRKEKAEKVKKRKSRKEKKTWLLVIMVVGGLVGIIFGSNLVVNSASEIARTLGVSERIIAMTIIALGTSLPELVTTIIASKKDQQGLLIGNAIGSNLFNICFALGLPIIIFGTLSVANFKIFDVVVMLIAAIMLPIVLKKDREVSRKEGVIMLVIFAIYYTVMLIWA